ncbi:GldG family protein [Megalodesulfovibrio gigas]|uniref:Putative ABC-type uncharacterized transport system involved in gliding motility auxiliary component-like protein n=1 Tax=Megalodesulfovibrio gigas (strain ATCC 19364 / DSM 1382 / NCIMB 9332 / VKM B-1759) TaxID=1121448 RepID=T2G6J5_MEGG1|nr:Gldg family protein [Megalodesulfovibrio gigas]AGW12195.1 putative ABC-type uncharacterized transport system involved in gliding motility auxiliary component-like protein [Megalodesulfovibrio gigas DSM 1382 = ATCC 19364]
MAAWKRYSQTILAGVLGLGLLAGCYALAAKQGWRYDTTSAKQHSLAVESVTILNNLNASVEAVAFFNPEDQPLKKQLEDLFDLVSRETDRVRVEFVDPDRTPFRARELGVTVSGSVVLRSGDRKEILTFVDEEKLVNGIARVASARSAVVYHVQGHGEVELEGLQEAGAGQLAQALREQGVEIAPLTLAAIPEGQGVPKDADLVLILAPTRNYLPKELDLLAEYVQAGGRMFIALAPEHPVNVADWTARHLGVRMEPGLAVDVAAQSILGDALTVLVQQYPIHPITKDFNLLTLYPTAGALTDVENATLGNRTLEVMPLGLSTQQAWLERDVAGIRTGRADFDAAADLQGPLWIGAAVSMVKELDADNATKTPLDNLRAVVLADQDFLTNRYANVYGNLDLARNAVNWLLEREGLIVVRKPDVPNVFLALSGGERLLLSWVPLVLLPLAMFGAALAVATIRKRAR